jgi:hypothetical protein
MAVTFTGTKLPQSELADIQQELYQDSATFREKYVDIQEGHKSGTDVYESKVTVTAKAASSGKVVADASINLRADKTPVVLTSIEFSDIIDESTLLDTRFERSMKAGAYNRISNEFDNAVLQQVTPAIGEALETMIWNGATSAQKVAIAALTPGAGQGSISAGAQTLVAAMPVSLINSLPATILYNSSQSKTVPGAGLGDYNKVLSIASVTSATIAAEYAKLYAASPPKVINNKTNFPYIYAPLGDQQLIKIANNAVGAAQQVNFLVEGSGANEKISYNGIEIKFVPLVGFRILADPRYLKVIMDLISDMSGLNIGEVGEGAMQRFIKNIQTLATWVTNQRYITMYGG